MSLISLSNQSQDNKEQSAPAFSFKNYFKTPIIIPPNSTIKLLSTKITKKGQRLSAKDNKGLIYSRNATGYSSVQMNDRISGAVVQKQIYAACPILHNLVNGDDGTHVDAGGIATELTDKINATQVIGKLQPSKIDGAMNGTDHSSTFDDPAKPYIDNYDTRGTWFGVEVDNSSSSPRSKLTSVQLPWAGQADPEEDAGGNLNNKNYRRAGSKSVANTAEQQVYSTTDSLTEYPDHDDTDVAGGVDTQYIIISHTCQNSVVGTDVLSGAAFGQTTQNGSCEWTRQPNTYCWWGLSRQDENERFPACCMGLMNSTWRKIVGENDNAQIQWSLANGSYDTEDLVEGEPRLGERQAYVYDHETMPMLQYAAIFENSSGDDVLQIFQTSKSPHLAYLDIINSATDNSWQKLSDEIALPDLADADEIYIKCQVPGEGAIGDGYGFEWSIAGDGKTGNTTTDWGAAFDSDAGDAPLVGINQVAIPARSIVANDYRYLPNMGSINPAILYGPEIGLDVSDTQVSTCKMAVYGNGTEEGAADYGYGAMSITNTPMTYGLWNSNEGVGGGNYKLWQPEDLYTTWDQIVRYYDPRYMGPVMKSVLQDCEDNITTLNTYSLANDVADNLQIVASRLTLEATSVRDNKLWKDILQIYGADGLPRASNGSLQTFGKLGLALGITKKIMFKTNTFSTATPSFTLEDQFKPFADLTNYSAYHLQLTNLPIISYNGTANKRVKDIAVLIAPTYSNASDATTTIVEYDMPTPIPIRLNNKDTLTLDTIDVLITYNNNHPARELVGEIDISLLLEQGR